MSFTIVAAIGVTMGAGKMIAGGVQRRKAKKRQQEAKDQMDKDVKKYIIPILPANVLTKGQFFKSDRHLGGTKNNIITVDGKKIASSYNF